MAKKAWKIAMIAALVGALGQDFAKADGPLDETTASVATVERSPSDGTAEPERTASVLEPRGMTEISASPSRPTWTGGASTSDRGEVESDFGWQWQSMGMAVQQWILPSSVRYGLTSKVELRWGLPAHMVQHGGGTAPLTGISDQSLSALYRFREQGKWLPALALNYGIKIPIANPAKGFGSGYADHQLVFIASRDIGRVHLDFNTVGTIAGSPDGHDGAAQYGLALSLPVSRRFTWLLDCYGGPTPGTTDRYGAALTGGTWALRPWLVLDTAYTRTYTAGAPRQQFTIGITHAMRPGLASAFKGSRVGRLLGQ